MKDFDSIECKYSIKLIFLVVVGDTYDMLLNLRYFAFQVTATWCQLVLPTRRERLGLLRPQQTERSKFGTCRGKHVLKHFQEVIYRFYTTKCQDVLVDVQFSFIYLRVHIRNGTPHHVGCSPFNGLLLRWLELPKSNLAWL